MHKTTEQQERDIKAAFDRVDKNKDGYLSKTEIEEYFKGTNKEDINKFMEAMGTTTNGRISFKEFKRILKDFKGPFESERLLWAFLESLLAPQSLLGSKKALLIVDVQNDFLPESLGRQGRKFVGSLAVKNGNQVIPVINELRKKFDADPNSLVALSQDWHPPGHCSFQSTWASQGSQLFQPFKIVCDGKEVMQMMWPDHCVQNGDGAMVHPDVVVKPTDFIVRKGYQLFVDSYSAFADNTNTYKTGLEKYFKEKGVGTLYICGIATDYCVRFTCMHAIECGFKTYMVADASRGVTEETTREAMAEMCKKGVIPINADEIQL
jgi:nicotinamidase/pyrazinamidase